MNTMNSSVNMEISKRTVSISDWVWAILVIGGSFYAWQVFGKLMDNYEIGILIGSAIGLIALGRFWQSIKPLTYSVAALSLLAVWTYQTHGNQIAINEQAFFLKFLVSSQSAIMWMSALFVLATVAYFLALFSKSDYVGKVASFLAWAGSTFGLVGMMVAGANLISSTGLRPHSSQQSI